MFIEHLQHAVLSDKRIPEMKKIKFLRHTYANEERSMQ